MTRVYFVRHGESEGNVGRFFQGQLDIPLTPLGVHQAELTADYFKDKAIDAVYSSDLGRTVVTAQKIADIKGLEVKTDSGLREIFAGEWQGVLFEKLARDFDDYKIWLENIGLSVCRNGESYREMQQRVDMAVKKIVSENKGKSIVVVTHGGPIRAINALWYNIEPDRIKEIPWVSNSSVSTVEYEDDGTVNVVEVGYNGHLGDMVTAFGKNV